MLRRNQNRIGDGPLRGQKISWMASTHPDMHPGPLLSVALENKIGEKKHHPLPYRSLGYFFRCCCQFGKKTLKPCSNWSSGLNGKTIWPIALIARRESAPVNRRCRVKKLRAGMGANYELDNRQVRQLSERL